MRKVISAGGLIFDGRHLLVVWHPNGHYGFPKGHVEPGETPEQAAIREVREETGLNAEIIRYVGRFSRPSHEDDGEFVHKDVEMFLMRVTGKANNEPMEQVKWLDFDIALKSPWHDAELTFLRQHVSALVNVAAHEDH